MGRIFRSLLSQSWVFPNCKAYGQQFPNRILLAFNCMPELLSDVWIDLEVLQLMTEIAFSSILESDANVSGSMSASQTLVSHFRAFFRSRSGGSQRISS